MCKLPVKWIKYQFYINGFSNTLVNMWLFKDFNCMIRFQQILRTLRNFVKFETDVYLLTFISPQWI